MVALIFIHMGLFDDLDHFHCFQEFLGQEEDNSKVSFIHHPPIKIPSHHSKLLNDFHQFYSDFDMPPSTIAA